MHAWYNLCRRYMDRMQQQHYPELAVTSESQQQISSSQLLGAERTVLQAQAQQVQRAEDAAASMARATQSSEAMRVRGAQPGAPVPGEEAMAAAGLLTRRGRRLVVLRSRKWARATRCVKGVTNKH